MMKDYEKIRSKENLKYKTAMSLFQQKYRKKTKLFPVEGLRTILQALDNEVKIEYLFVEDECIQKHSSILAEKSLVEKTLLLDKQLFRNLTDTVHSQGIVAICHIKEQNFNEALQKGQRLLVIDRVQDPGNLGTLLRTALAYKMDAVLLTKGSVDIYSPKVTRSSMGANISMNIIQNAQTSEVLSLKKSGYALYAASLDAQAVEYREVRFEKKSALILGNEANGISKEILESCDYKIIIPIGNEMESLNVGIAGAILMNEIFAQQRQSLSQSG